MKNVLAQILPNLPWLVGVILGVVLFFTYKKLRGWLSVIGVLISAVETIDDGVQDIVPDKARAVMTKVKNLINNMLKSEDKVLLDKLLREKGYKQ